MSEIIYKYDDKKYDFCSLISELFVGCQRLEELHMALPHEEIYDIVNFENDNETWFHKVFYDKLNRGWPEFNNLYKEFISDVVTGVMGNNEFVFQTRPTFRVQIPMNKSVGEFHRDYDYNHQLGEINFVLALTDMLDSGTIWIESFPGLRNYHPINVKKGNMAIFNGNMCTHGNKINKTDLTRVSMDFRVLSKNLYDPYFEKSSSSKNIPMLIGGYYDEIK